jgi:predicted nucleic acid-binding protein
VIGIDSNLLIALAVHEHPNHTGALALIESELESNERFALSPAVASEFLHVGYLKSLPFRD